eukprot:m.669125 g.669125  ORF g.669125 m.669125 type:complete len:55 (+) comp22759_c1_seq14:608-772(+)
MHLNAPMCVCPDSSLLQRTRVLPIKSNILVRTSSASHPPHAQWIVCEGGIVAVL